MAQLALSANDGKQPRLGQQPADVRPDNVAVIDLGHYPPKVLGSVDVPVSMIGPPTIVAVAPDESFAIVTASQKLDPDDPSKFVLDDKVSVLDLRDPARPVVVQSLTAGKGATGVAINRAATLALVAATGDGTISIFSIKDRKLIPAGKLQLDPEPGPVDVAIAPDGKTALVTQRRGNAIWRLTIDGTRVTNSGVMFATGGNPYGTVISPDSNFAYSTNLQGRLDSGGLLPAAGAGPRIGTITAIDLRTNRIVNDVEVGPTPEHVSMSPDGRYLAVTVVNGSSSPPSAPGYHDFGLLKVFRVEGAALTQVAEARTGQWGQGSTWSGDGRVILQQGAIARNIEVYRFDGQNLVRDDAATIGFDTRPGAIATSSSR